MPRPYNNKSAQLTEHFHLDEFTKSTIADANKIDNAIPSLLVFNNIRRLADELEVVRKFIKAPMVITSGYRCDALNAKVGGVPNSAHNLGLAADWHPVGKNLEDVFENIIDNNIVFIYDQLILEHKPNTSWIHYAIAEPGLKPRREHLTIDMR